MKAFFAAAAWWRSVLHVALGAMVALMTVSVFTQIILRGVFSYSFLPLDDITPYSFSIATFLGAALLFGDNGHVAITVFSEMAPAPLRKAALVFSHVVVFAFLVFFLAAGVDFAADGRFQFSPLLGIPLVYVHAVIPASAFSGLVFLIESLLKPAAAGAEEN